MSTNRALKTKLARRDLTIGSWISFGYPAIGEMMAKAGFDWLVIDMEHTAIDFDAAEQLIRIIDLAGCDALVRVGANDPLLIKRAMDCGATGVVVPMVNSNADATAAVAAAYYPPVGTRGVGLYRAQDYGLGFEEYRKRAVEETVVIVQIEHEAAISQLDDILSVPGVDGFIVGPYDLSASFGVPGQFDDPRFIAAMEQISEAAAHRAGGFHIVFPDQTEMQRRIDQGFTFLAYGDDMIFLAEKVRQEGNFVKTLLG